ncbi:hypothetical protein PV328_004140 [Microctonus aethiopoides]|uniref:Uncharacterized protein n=1 Tax=Microctonus aethiopoides TaxID=144406 RepID=A0AA39KL88_9HYME|nr:hypothetical protein PV328_004140 [Microctonus aethiopoides]
MAVWRKRPCMDNDTKQTNKTIVPGPLLDQEEKAIEPGAGKPRVRYSSAARRRFKEEQRKLGAEQAQGTSAPELTDGGGESAQKRRETTARPFVPEISSFECKRILFPSITDIDASTGRTENPRPVPKSG